MNPMPVCATCDGVEWVCENHPDRPWAANCCQLPGQASGNPAHRCCACGAGSPCGECDSPSYGFGCAVGQELLEPMVSHATVARRRTVVITSSASRRPGWAAGEVAADDAMARVKPTGPPALAVPLHHQPTPDFTR